MFSIVFDCFRYFSLHLALWSWDPPQSVGAVGALGAGIVGCSRWVSGHIHSAHSASGLALGSWVKSLQKNLADFECQVTGSTRQNTIDTYWYLVDPNAAYVCYPLFTVSLWIVVYGECLWRTGDALHICAPPMHRCFFKKSVKKTTDMQWLQCNQYQHYQIILHSFSGKKLQIVLLTCPQPDSPPSGEAEPGAKVVELEQHKQLGEMKKPLQNHCARRRCQHWMIFLGLKRCVK